jgi:hypothetical protein
MSELFSAPRTGKNTAIILLLRRFGEACARKHPIWCALQLETSLPAVRQNRE